MNFIHCKEPGIYYDIPGEEYYAHPAMSNSRLGEFMACPPKFHARRARDSAAMSFGRLAHEYFLERDNFKRENYFTSHTNLTLKAAKEEKAKIVRTGRKYHKRTVLRDLWRMNRAMFSSHRATQLMKAAGASEVTLLFEHEGVLCKSRMDRYAVINGVHFIIDLKVIGLRADEVMSVETLRRYANKYNLARQAAFYSNGLATLIPDADVRFVNIFIEKPTDYKTDVMCIPATIEDQDLVIAEMEIADGLEQYKQCEATHYPSIDEWMGIETGFLSLSQYN